MSTNFKSIKAERTTETRNIHDLESHGTGNIFETIVALSKRSNQVALSLKKELAEKLEEFVIPTDSSKKCSRTASRLKSPSSTSAFPSRTASPSRSCKTNPCTSLALQTIRKKLPPKKPNPTRPCPWPLPLLNVH